MKNVFRLSESAHPLKPAANSVKIIVEYLAGKSIEICLGAGEDQ